MADSYNTFYILDGRNISLSSVKKLAKAFEKMPAEENGSESLQRPSPIQSKLYFYLKVCRGLSGANIFRNINIILHINLFSVSEENNLEHNGEVIITPTINSKYWNYGLPYLKCISSLVQCVVPIN